jgi:Flp pilus assembly protein TadD
MQDSLEVARELLQRGRPVEAALMCERLIEERSVDPGVYVLLASARYREGDMEGALTVAEKAASLNWNSQEVHSILASLHWRTGNVTQAAEHTQEIVRLDPGNCHAMASLGVCLAESGRNDLAVDWFEKAIALRPNNGVFHHNYAIALKKLERLDEAVREFRAAMALGCTAFESYVDLGAILMVLGRDEEAIECQRAAQSMEPNSVRGRLEGAKAATSAGELDAAEDLLRSVLADQPEEATAIGLLGCVQQKRGLYDPAADLLRKSIQLAPSSPGAYCDLVKGIKVSPRDLPLVETMAEMQSDPSRSWSDKRLLAFALGKAYVDLEQFGRAMSYFDTAHTIEIDRFGKQFDQERYGAWIDAIIDANPAESPSDRDQPSSDSARPIFILGMMRSGTTLIEQVLSSHPHVAAGGEIRFWIDETRQTRTHPPSALGIRRCRELIDGYLDRLNRIDPTSLHVTDKVPDNYLLIGLIRRLFPRARIIHCKRDPVDNCLSIYTNLFMTTPNYAHDKADLAFVYREYERLMRHWKSVVPQGAIFDVRYEELVAEPEDVARRLLAFCDLEWDDRCLSPELNKRSVMTVSHWQVRQPIYRTSVERWRRFEPWLGPLLDLRRDTDRTR